MLIKLKRVVDFSCIWIIFFKSLHWISLMNGFLLMAFTKNLIKIFICFTYSRFFISIIKWFCIKICLAYLKWYFLICMTFIDFLVDNNYSTVNNYNIQKKVKFVSKNQSFELKLLMQIVGCFLHIESGPQTIFLIKTFFGLVR